MTVLPGASTSVPLIDLGAQRARIGRRIDDAIARVLDHGQFIHGPEVFLLEDRLSSMTGACHAITCASGTDALYLALMALGIGRGDAVFVPAFSFPAPAEVAVLVGATPVFVDVDETRGMLDVASLEAAIDSLTGLRPRAVIAVDLYGHTADYDAIRRVADARDMVVVADAAQSFGASCNGSKTGTLAEVTTTSFYPAKPLGCYGDGGCVFTDCDNLAAAVRSLRVHGQEDNSTFTRVGVNARLDTLQAAVLIEKLAILESEHATRQRVATRYAEGLQDVVDVPQAMPGCVHAWACYTIQSARRELIECALHNCAISTAVYYRTPLHWQPAYRDYPVAPDGLPVAERLASKVLSLPMHPYLDEATQCLIVNSIRSAIE